jgi:hypothetical protein
MRRLIPESTNTCSITTWKYNVLNIYISSENILKKVGYFCDK